MSGKKIHYVEYHEESMRIGDVDPSNAMLIYLCNRFELNMEQRYWLAFLYSTCYCGPTTFYMYNEFPDFAGVDVPRLQRWWKNNKDKCLFQTDRLRVKTMDQFVPTFESYRDKIGALTQQEFYRRLKTGHPTVNYDNAYKEMGKVRNIGRFTLFIYLELVNVLTDFKCLPRFIDWSNAENCAAGLNYAVKDKIPLDNKLLKLEYVFPNSNIFNIETTLCAYAKYMKGKRYIGYYLDRQRKEIDKMKSNVTSGVCWRVLDEYRRETYKSNPYTTLPI